MVDRAFQMLDKDNTGIVNLSDLASIYDVSKDKSFIDGSKTKEQLLNEFLNSFDGAKGDNNGKVTKQEFVDYYTDLATSIPSDDYFVTMMEQAWCISEDDQSTVFQDKIRQLIGMMRQRLLTLSNHSEEEFTLRKIFKDFDLNGSGSIAIDELGAMLAKLGICVDRKYIYAMLKKLDTNNSGVLEFEEFANLILYDPYK